MIFLVWCHFFQCFHGFGRVRAAGWLGDRGALLSLGWSRCRLQPNLFWIEISCFGGFLVEREGTYFSIPLIFTRKIELLAKCSDSQKSPWLSLLTLSWWNYVNRFQAQGQEFFSRFTAIQTYVGRFVASGWCQCGGFRRYTAGAAFGDF